MANVLLHNGSQINLACHSELLHSITYETSQAHSFNTVPIQTIGHGMFTIKLVDRTIDLPTLVLPPNDQPVQHGVASYVSPEREGPMFQHVNLEKRHYKSE